MNGLHQMSAAVDRFIRKASKKNEPLEAFRETEDFKKFEGDLSSGIRDQVSDITKKLPAWMITDDAFDEKKVSGWLEDNQKTIAKYVKEKDVLATLIKAFTYSVESSYQRQGIKLQKAAEPYVTFELTNSYYLDALADQANYLLHKSSIDETTRNRMITLIRDVRSSAATIDELTNIITDEFEGISDTRAFMIANTEANQAMSSAQQAFLVENGVATKQWVGAGPNTCSICQGNEDQGPISVNSDFDSGDMHPPAHPGCECYEDAGEEIDLDSIDVLWDGSGDSINRSTEAKFQKQYEQITKKLEAVTSQSVSLEQNANKSQAELHSKMEALQKYIDDQKTEIIQILKAKDKPIYKTIVKNAQIPPELLTILELLAAQITAPVEVSDPEPVILLSDYKPHDEDEAVNDDDPDFYGFLHPSGAWYIVRGVDDHQRYAAGDSGYSKAWTNRKDLKYVYISEAFS